MNPGETAYIATFYKGQLLGATVKVAKDLDSRATPGEHQRIQVHAFFVLLEDPHNDLYDLNRDASTVFTPLVAVPDSNKVKVIYRLGIGTASIRQISPITGKLSALFAGDRGGVLGLA